VNPVLSVVTSDGRHWGPGQSGADRCR